MTTQTIDPSKAAHYAMKAEPVALEHIAEAGPGYFNPLIGNSDAATFSNISDVMHFLHDTLETKDNICEVAPGIKLLVQTVWAASQYESVRHERADRGGDGR
jgi:hypothetical protein